MSISLTLKLTLKNCFKPGEWSFHDQWPEQNEYDNSKSIVSRGVSSTNYGKRQQEFYEPIVS